MTVNHDVTGSSPVGGVFIRIKDVDKSTFFLYFYPKSDIYVLFSFEVLAYNGLIKNTEVMIMVQEFNEIEFLAVYEQVRPTVLRLKKAYYIKLWTRDDWEQEGMIVLNDLLVRQPQLTGNHERLRIYFKTKFSNRVKDMIRSQESQKRRFDRMPYLDLSEVAHLVPSRQMIQDELVAFKASLEAVKPHLTAWELDNLDRLMTGEAFEGRAKLVKKLQGLMGK